MKATLGYKGFYAKENYYQLYEVELDGKIKCDTDNIDLLVSAYNNLQAENDRLKAEAKMGNVPYRTAIEWKQALKEIRSHADKGRENCMLCQGAYKTADEAIEETT